MKVRLTKGEATTLFIGASNYGRVSAEQRQRKDDEWWAEHAAREADVLVAYRRLKKAANKIENGYRFGPEKESEEFLLPEIGLGEQERDGIYWICLAALDPRSPGKQVVAACEEYVWPVLEKIRRTNAAQKELKIGSTRRPMIEDDPVTPNLTKVEDDPKDKDVEPAPVPEESKT